MHRHAWCACVQRRTRIERVEGFSAPRMVTMPTLVLFPVKEGARVERSTWPRSCTSRAPVATAACSSAAVVTTVMSASANASTGVSVSACRRRSAVPMAPGGGWTCTCTGPSEFVRISRSPLSSRQVSIRAQVEGSPSALSIAK